ncbi:MAG: MFS transporter [bacterium]
MSAVAHSAWRWIPKPDRANAGMWAIAAGHATTHAYSAAFYLMLPFIARELGLSYSQLGLFLSVRQFMSMLVNLPAGMIVDTIGKRNLLMALAMAWTAVPYLIIAATSHYGLILVAMALIGIGMFLWHPAAITSISEMYPSRRGYGLALHEVGANLGDTLAPLAAGFLLGYLTWRQVMTINVALGLILMLIIVRAVAHANRTRQERSSRGVSFREYVEGVRVLFRNVSLMLLALLSGVRSMTQHGLTTFLPLYLVNDLHLSPAVLGLYLTIVQASGMIATPIAGTLSDRVGPKRVATMGMFTSSVILLGFAAIDLGSVFVAALALLGFFVYSMRPAILRWAIGVVPRQYEGTTVGALFTTQALFSTLMPLVGGAIADHYGLLAVFYLIAGTMLVANLAVFAVPDLRRPVSPEALAEAK